MALDVLAGLNERQRQAVSHGEGPLLVVAGAGSGKTRVITHRLANLIQRGTRPDRILAITFTNKAAGEMRERVEDLLNLTTPWICTFHSLGLRLLKMEQARLGWTQTPTILDEDDQRRMWKRVFEGLGVEVEADVVREVGHQVSAWKNALKTPEVIAQQQGADAVSDLVVRAYRRYREMCAEEGVVDFDDLLLLPVELLTRDEEARSSWQARFPYMLIDEYQDTNEAQYRLVRLLSGHGNICATGDPDQAIYGWRGANISNILNFERDFPGCTTVLLEQNYRSTKVILRAAQGVVEHNVNRKPKTIFSENAEGDPISVITVADQDDEAMAVAAAVARLRQQGRRLDDIAVFYRTNAQSRVLEEWLIRRQIPYRIVGGVRFFDRLEVKHLLAYLRLMINPRDLTSLLRIVNVPRRGLGDTTLERLRDLAHEEGVAVYEVLMDDALLDRLAVGRAARPLRELALLLRRLQAMDRRDPAACVKRVLDLTGLADFIRGDGEDEKAQERLANLDEALTAAEQFGKAYPEAGLDGFLDHVALLTSVDQRSGEGEALVLMTLHASKGLEFPVVFIVGCEQGMLPLVHEHRPCDYEEERRLMYVGMTRARENLFLSNALIRQRFGRGGLQAVRMAPSQFLAEIPDGCIQHRDRVRDAGALGRAETATGPAYPEASLASLLVENAGAERIRDALQHLGGRLLTTGAVLKEALASAGATSPTGAASAAGQTKPRRRKLKAGPAGAGDPYAIGATVRHDMLGPGTVRGYGGAGDQRCVIIDFEHGGEKEMLLIFAGRRLRPV